MKYRAILYHGADECWSGDSEQLLPLLMRSNDIMARERRGRKGPCDGGVIFRDGAEWRTLKDEHWV